VLMKWELEDLEDKGRMARGGIVLGQARGVTSARGKSRSPAGRIAPADPVRPPTPAPVAIPVLPDYHFLCAEYACGGFLLLAAGFWCFARVQRRAPWRRKAVSF
jgi:hypothetical protein